MQNKQTSELTKKTNNSSFNTKLNPVFCRLFYRGFKTFIAIQILFSLSLYGAVKTSISNGNWNNPAIWNPVGVPQSADKVFIYHAVILNQNFTANDTIFVMNTLSFGNNNILNLNPGTMILVNDANYDGKIGTVNNGANILGNYTFQKWIARCDGSSTYGSPFTVLTTDFDWYYCYQCMGPTWSNLYYYDETVPGTLDMGYYDNVGGILNRGKGFFYWYANYGGGLNFSRKISLTGSTDFTAQFDFNISRTVSNGIAHDGYNLVANPFPGTIDWLSNGWTKKKLLDAIYVWNTCTDSYSSFVGGVGVNGGTRYIPSMQGFWVQGIGNNPKLKVTRAVLTNTAQALLKPNSSNDTVNYVLRLKLNNDEIAIRLDAASTNQIDTLSDAVKFLSDNSTLYSYNQSDSIIYSINSIQDTTCFVLIKNKGGGILNFSGVSTFFGQYSIYLKDIVTSAYQLVSEGMQYNFSDTSTVTFNNRFEVHFVKNNLTSIKNNLMEFYEINYDVENIYIKVKSIEAGKTGVKMFDLMGRELYTNSFDQTNIRIPKMNIPVLLRITNRKGIQTKKYSEFKKPLLLKRYPIFISNAK